MHMIRACHSIRHQDPCIIIREYMIIANDFNHCMDFATMLKNYENHIGEDSMTRIRNYTETKTDFVRAAQAVFHYNLLNKQLLEKNMTWQRWIMCKLDPTL